MLKILCFIAMSLKIAAAQSVPASLLNHDVNQGTLAETVCLSGYTKTVRPSTTYTNRIKMRLLTEKGLHYEAKKGNYELDHIIPLALGGHPRNLSNLTLQLWDGHDGAKRKDRIEVKLQCLVCSGEVPLTVAQDAIWTDWKAAYSSYSKMVCHRVRGMRSGDYGDETR